jgi:hypothetical protein
MADQFKYQPEWQGPLSGRSFEKQTEDAINRALASGTANASDATPLQAGTASPGTSDEWSRGDHIHPPQTTITGNAATATRLLNTRNITLNGDASGTAAFNGTGDANIPVTIPLATTSQKGLMSSADKTKLDSVEAGANNYTLPEATASTLGGVRVDTALNGSSTNPVRNSAVKAGLDSLQSQIDQTVKLTGTQTVAGAKTFTSPINGQLNGNANSATRLASGRYIGLSGAVSAQSQVFTGENDVTILVNSLDATKLTGIAPVNTSGNAATASKLYTARSIALVGDVEGSASFDGASNISIPTKPKSCVASKNQTGSSNSWGKVASVTCNSSNMDYSIVFLVKNNFIYADNIGILELHIRTKANSSDIDPSYVILRWLANTGFDENHFAAVIPTGAQDAIELWSNQYDGWSIRTFTDISEVRGRDIGSYFSLFSPTIDDSQSTLPSGTQVFSSAATYVTLSSNQTISGTKTFSKPIVSDSSQASYSICSSSDNSYTYFCGGASSQATAGAALSLSGSGYATNPGTFMLRARSSGGTTKDLIGSPDGTFTWGGQPIQTASDERVKTALCSVPDKVLDAWGDVQWGQFQYLEAVDAKGKDARLHLGLIAQRVKASFDARGLDACAYGILCHEVRPEINEEWTVVDVEAYVDEEGVEHPAETHAENRHEDAVDLWMVRYAEAQAMEAAYQRRRAGLAEARIAALEDRLAAIEAKINR